MAFLAIDIGNTWCKIATVEDDEITYITSLPTDSEEDIIEWLDNSYFQRGIYCTTADLGTKLQQTLSEKEIIAFGPEMKFPFVIQYKTPQTLGRDRLAAVAGASALYPEQNCLIIDAGTCITYDILTAEGAYIGGNISPGLHMRAKAMDEFTDKLPLVNVLNWNLQEIGQSTEEALEAGANMGLVLEIEGYIRLCQRDNRLWTNLLTGGDAYYLQEKINSKIFVRPDLVFRGLIQTYNTYAQENS